MDIDSSIPGPCYDFCQLNRSLQDRRPSAREKLGADFKQKMDALISEIEKTAPSLKALYQYEALREKERVVTEEFEAARMEEKQIADGYNAVKQRRGLIQLVNLAKPSTLCTQILHLLNLSRLENVLNMVQ
ncbi:structural maintenance of chromosomes protein 1 isoform X1 [Populus alba]|uniref:structural maintenance of chromosomes protein 1 isoform X1 n=1 Tax=Populus alba TaxID=43335 RepID=UPI003CC794EF